MNNIDYKEIGFKDLNFTINFQKKLDKLLSKLDYTPSLLLHSCCGPCSSYCLEYLSKYFNITVFYYNPNIYPSSEYDMRIKEQKQIIDFVKKENEIKLIEGEYNTKIYYKAIAGLEKEPEGGKRCIKCYELRLEQAAKLANEFKYDYFTTSLTISPMKSSHILNYIGRNMGEKYNVQYLDTDFKKKNGYKRSVEITKELNIYRQEYCGCIFSKKEADERINKK